MFIKAKKYCVLWHGVRHLREKYIAGYLDWKLNSNGGKALLVEGARRIGKSTIVEEFGKNEYKSYILIVFSITSGTINNYLKDNWISPI